MKSNTSGIVGVSRHNHSGGWQSYIGYQSKLVSLGLYSNKRTAAVARVLGERKYNKQQELIETIRKMEEPIDTDALRRRFSADEVAAVMKEIAEGKE